MEPSAAPDDFPPRAGFLLLRAFLGSFWALQFYFKLRNPKDGSFGVEALWAWSSKQVESFASSTPLGPWAVRPYTLVVPWVELTLGLLLLIGYKTRWTLVAGCVLLVSLDLGLMLQGDHDTVKSNTLILFAMLLALQWSRYDRWSVDRSLAAR